MPKRHRVKDSLEDTAERVFSLTTGFTWLGGIILGTVAGPFGTLDDMALPVRFVFWVVIVTLAVLLGYAGRALAMIFVGQKRPHVFDTAAILFVTALFAPVIWVVGHGFERAVDAKVPPFALIVLYVLVMSIAIFMARRHIPGFEYPAEAETGGDGDDQPPHRHEPRLLRRLSPEQRADILRLSADGHYIAVITLIGEHTLRMRLSDAIHEMEPVRGYNTHRSHWVAHHAISHGERENAHKAYLVLINGDKVPVSRRYRPHLEENGLL